MRKLHILATLSLSVIAAPAFAVEPFATYDNFNSKSKRLDPTRWEGSERCCNSAETQRSIKRKKASMSHRSYGDTSTDEGRNTSRNRLSFPDPDSVSQMKARLVINKYQLTDCEDNRDDIGNVRARLVGSFFNSKRRSSGEDGDVWAAIELRRNFNTRGGKKFFDVVAWAGRCEDEVCGEFTDLPGPGSLGQVKKGGTLSLIHDRDSNKFVMQVNNNGPVEISYGDEGWDEVSDPGFSAKWIELRTDPENCTAEPAEAYIDASVDNVKVNRSALR